MVFLINSLFYDKLGEGKAVKPSEKIVWDTQTLNLGKTLFVSNVVPTNLLTRRIQNHAALRMRKVKKTDGGILKR